MLQYFKMHKFVYPKNKILNMPLTQFIQKLEELGTMSDDVKLQFHSFSSVLQLEKKKTILKQGTLCNKIWFLASGSIRMYRIENNKDITLHLITHSRFFTDLIALTEQSPSTLQIETIDPCTIIVLNAKELQKLLDTDLPSERIGRKLYQQLLFEETKRLQDSIFLSANERYIKLIASAPEIFQKIPQKHIASYLHIKPETLSRIRKQN